MTESWMLTVASQPLFSSDREALREIMTCLNAEGVEYYY
jgi:hypothetical protein